jgi:uncharacterized membrane protein (TIGR01666 family)
MAEYNLRLRKFLNSQYVYTGVRITAGVLIPAMVLYHYDLLAVAMGVPLGALFLALPDNPGPLHHRINGMIAGIIINFCVLVIAGYSHSSDLLIGIEIVVFSFLFSMFGIYGARADSIGLIALVAFVVSYGSGTFGQHPPIQTAVYFAAGGAWYSLLSITFSGIQPYKPVQQLLGEYLIEIGRYLEERAKFYDKATDVSKHLTELYPRQVVIQKHQNDLREMLFKTRLFVKESTNKGRRLVMAFLESTDLLERIITAQQNYTELHREFDDSDILDQFKQNIQLLAKHLELTGTAIQSGESFINDKAVDDALEQSRRSFFDLRTARLSSANMESFIKLRHILYSLTDLSERVKRLQGYTTPDRKVKEQVNEEYLQAFVTHQDYSFRKFIDNLSLNSGQFRHAIRLTVAMLAGYILSLLLPLGHSYWILLSIATILKPAFSASRKRNIQRVAGTLIGVGIAFLTLYLSKSNTPIFIIMLVGMLIAYTTLRIDYFISTAAITLYVVLSFHFLYAASLNGLLLDRVVDTIAGALICLAAAYFILPKWESEQMNDMLKKAAEDNMRYFKAVAQYMKDKENEHLLEYKLARKSAFISLANVADGLQRMLNEPKSRQKQLEEVHQLVASSHMLTSYIASLAAYAEQHNGKYDVADLKPMLQYISRQFDLLNELHQNPGVMLRKQDPFPISKKIQQLLQQRKTELEIGLSGDASTIRHTISLLKALTDQLQLINSVLEEEIRILMKMNSVTDVIE